jgi:hypothetical protein
VAISVAGGHARRPAVVESVVKALFRPAEVLHVSPHMME